MEKRLLITGFDAFGGSEENPSWMAVSQLPDKIGCFTLKKRMLPTVYGKAAQTVLEAAEDFSPDLILCVGVAAGRDAVTPERIAVNIPEVREKIGATQLKNGELYGVSGWEKSYDTLLRGTPGKYEVMLDRRRRWIDSSWKLVTPAVPGKDVKVPFRLEEIR